MIQPIRIVSSTIAMNPPASGQNMAATIPDDPATR